MRTTPKKLRSRATMESASVNPVSKSAHRSHTDTATRPTYRAVATPQTTPRASTSTRTAVAISAFRSATNMGVMRAMADSVPTRHDGR
jgi:hypothetical protein